MNEEKKLIPNGRDEPIVDKRTEKKKDKKKKWIIRTVILIIIILILLFGIKKCKEPDPGYIIGAGVKEGELYRKNDIQSGGSDETSSMRIKINGRPIFADGKSEGNLEIENPAENSLYMEVSIKLDDTGEVIYESGAIPPNHYIDQDKLAMVLKKGEYPATAYFTLFNPEDQDAQYNSINFDLIIKIEN